MTVRLAGRVAHLEGDWTINGVMGNLSSLADSLDRLESEGRKSLQVDCEKVEETDNSGLQLLNVLFECARIRGIKPELVNVNQNMQRTISKLGFMPRFRM